MLLALLLVMWASNPLPAAADDPLYTVRPGDTLWALSVRHNITIGQIVVGNGLTDANRIYVGQVLRLPNAEPSPLDFALSQVGKPYRWGATGPDAYDCSGLTWRAYQSVGVTLPRVAAAQYRAAVLVEEPEPGDLAFFDSFGRGIDHVGLYMGEGMLVHAVGIGARAVVVEPLQEYIGLVGFGRLP